MFCKPFDNAICGRFCYMCIVPHMCIAFLMCAQKNYWVWKWLVAASASSLDAVRRSYPFLGHWQIQIKQACRRLIGRGERPFADSKDVCFLLRPVHCTTQQGDRWSNFFFLNSWRRLSRSHWWYRVCHADLKCNLKRCTSQADLGWRKFEASQWTRLACSCYSEGHGSAMLHYWS